MHIEKDYEDLLKLFNKYQVQYCVVGAFAIAYHALPRYTKDLDILVRPDSKNAGKIIMALHEFGFGGLDINEQDFSVENKIVQLGYEPVRVDIITSINGCTFSEIWKNKVTALYGRQKIYYIGMQELIKNKKITNRPQDKIDLKVLLQKKGNK